MHDHGPFTCPPDITLQAVALTIAPWRDGCCNVLTFELERFHENPARARVAATCRHAFRLWLQRHAKTGRGSQGVVVGSAQSVPAPRRPGAEPGQYGQGLCPA